MFTDIKGFTERVSQSSRDGLMKLQALHDRLLPPVFQHFGGTIVKTIGDAYLVYFESPTNAVQCGVAIQAVLRQHNEQLDDDGDKLEVRVAINTGEVYFANDDVLGEPVNIAARLEGIAEAGEVYFTESTYLAMNRAEAPSAEVGEKLFKGIPYPIKVYQAIQDPGAKIDVDGFIEAINQKAKSELSPGDGVARSRSYKLKAAIASLFVVGVGTMAYYLSAIYPVQNAHNEASFFAEVSDFDQAIARLDSAMGHEHLRAESLAMAIDFADKRIAQFDDPDEALEWVRRMVQEHGYLSELQQRIPALKKRKEIIWLKNNPTDSQYFSRFYRLLDEYPDDPQLPLEMEKILDQHLTYHTRLKLFLRALDNGAEQEDRIFSYLEKIFTHTAATGWSDPGFDIATKHYPAKAKRWALEKIDGHHGQQYMAAWRLLSSFEHQYIKETYYQRLDQLMRGYDDKSEAEQALAYFLTLSELQRQKQVLALHAWVELDDKEVDSWGYRGKNYTQSNHQALKSHYSLR
jgi:class 3 adenylate cyclase